MAKDGSPSSARHASSLLAQPQSPCWLAYSPPLPHRGTSGASTLALGTKGPHCPLELPPGSEATPKEGVAFGHSGDTSVLCSWPRGPVLPTPLLTSVPGCLQPHRLLCFQVGSCYPILMYLLQIFIVFILRPCF